MQWKPHKLKAEVGGFWVVIMWGTESDVPGDGMA